MIDTSMIDVDNLILEDTLYYDDLDVSIEVNLMLAFTPYILHCYWNEDTRNYDFAQLCRDYNFDPNRNVMIQLSEYEKLFYLSVKEDIDKFYDLVDKDFVEDFFYDDAAAVVRERRADEKIAEDVYRYDAWEDEVGRHIR